MQIKFIRLCIHSLFLKKNIIIALHLQILNIISFQNIEELYSYQIVIN